MLLSYIFFVALALIPASWSTCYSPDGTALLDPDFQPCNSTEGSVSMCCATARASFKDVCLPNGLCQNPCDASGSCGGSGQFWREFCTDQTWQSPFCLKSVCTGGSSSNSTGVMVRCAIDGNWCCGPTTPEACCASNERLTLQATLGRSIASATLSPVSLTTTSASITDAATVSTPSSASFTASSTSAGIAATASALITGPTPTPSSSNASFSLGEGIGIGIGIGLTVIIIAIVALIIFLRRRKQLEKIDKKPQHDSSWQESYKKPLPETSFHEVHGHTHHAAELPSQYQHWA